MTRVGETGGRFWGSGKELSGFRNVPENFANQPALRDEAEMAAVGAIRVRTDDKDFPGLRVDLLDLFNHCTVKGVFKNYDIAWFERTQNVRDTGGNHVISLVVFGCQAVPSDFDEFEHFLNDEREALGLASPTHNTYRTNFRKEPHSVILCP